MPHSDKRKHYNLSIKAVLLAASFKIANDSESSPSTRR